MKIINISKAKYRNLQELKIDEDSRGFEGEMYYLPYNGVDKVFKNLYYNHGTVFANKLFTLEEIDSNKEFLPNSFVLPEFLCSVQSKLSGFAMPYVDGINLNTFLNDIKKDSKQKVYYLRKIGDILEQLKHIREYTNIKDLYIGDLHEANFMIDRNSLDLRVIDVDSIKINYNKPFPSKYLLPFGLLKNTPNKYEIYNDSFLQIKDIVFTDTKKYNYKNNFSYLMINENTDYYCYNIVLLNFLYGADINSLNINEYYNYLNYLDSLKIDNLLLDSFNRIVTDNVDNINPRDAVSTLDYKILSLANKKIYEKKKSGKSI